MRDAKELEESNKYQDFATDVLLRDGFIVQCYTSYENQIHKGESRQGVEIKNDRLVSQTGNLCFEAYEKDKNGNWIESGILRKDNTIFIFIGDYKRAWLVVKKQIKALLNKQKFQIYTTETSKGILIPVEFFDKYDSLVIKKYVF